jgi:hypothetical protein
MKKTIITLLALCGVAAAADMPKEYVATFANSRTDTQSTARSHILLDGGTQAITLNSWMIEFQIQKQSDIGAFFALGRNANNQERGGLGLRTNSASGIGISWNGNAGYANSTTEDPNPKLTVTNFSSISAQSPITLRFAYDAESDIAYLYNVDTDEYITATNLSTKYEGGNFSFSSVDSSVTGNGDKAGKTMFWTDSSSASYKLLGVTDMSSLEGDNTQFVGYLTTKTVSYIPEPTTATLSLLALAGLAARRRRK